MRTTVAVNEYPRHDDVIYRGASRDITSHPPDGVAQHAGKSGVGRARAPSFVAIYRTTQPDNLVQDTERSPDNDEGHGVIGSAHGKVSPRAF